jgi:hypothetical protein
MLYVNVWSVEYEQFGDFAAVEDFQDLEQQQALVEESPCCIPVDPITTCILITPLFIIACIKLMGPIAKARLALLSYALIYMGLCLCWVDHA